MHVDEATLRRTVAKNITAYRKAHRDTQLGLAEKLNYSDKSVSKWERGEGLPDVFILSQIADLYGVTVSNLIGEEKPPERSDPLHHLFILVLSIALAFSVAAVLFTVFTIVGVDYPAWLLFVYAIPASAIIAVVFTSLWWSFLWQGISISVLIWSLGLSLCLSLDVPNIHLIFVVCAAAQVLTVLWELFRHLRQKRHA